jgi:hypothetical protein
MRHPKHEVCSEPEDTVFRDQKEAASFLRCLGPFWQGKPMAIYPDQTCSNIDCGVVAFAVTDTSSTRGIQIVRAA